MNSFKQTILIRHRRENLKKCSLRGLETRSDLCFLKYPLPQLKLDNYLLLTMDDASPLLTSEDKDFGLIFLDATWKLSKKMEAQLDLNVTRRSLPSSFKTAYPRRQTDCPYPDRGLATVEALAIAHFILGRNCQGLLDHYYWKEDFLKLNLLDPSFF